MFLRKLARKALATLTLSMLCMVAFAQNRSVSGTIVDEAGEAVIGASVKEVGTNNGAVTDLNGNFKLNVGNAAKLQISYIGYEAQTITVGNRTSINVTMREDQHSLDEVVVIGYGTMKKRDLTGSVASVKQSDLQKVASTDAMSAMQARIPGLDIQTSSGEAGAGLNMTLRGNRSISASNSPLILVDGIEYGSTMDIPVTDIESMEVLKDASSTAIYGTKGANGVIIITTKRGQEGKTKVNFNAYWSFNSPTKTAETMYGDKEVQRVIDKAQYAKDFVAYEASGRTAWGDPTTITAANVLTEALADGTTQMDIYNDKSYTDWIDKLLRNTLTQNYELSVSGGNKNTVFNISAAVMNHEGLMKGDELNRYTGRVNLEHKINDIFTVGTRLNYTYRNNDSRNGGVYNQALKMTTVTHAYLNDGSINATPNPWYAAHCSPLLDDVSGAYQRNNEMTRFFGNAYVEITPIKGLVGKSLFSLSRRNSRNGQYIDYESQQRYQSPTTSYISNEQSVSTGYTWQNTLNYNTNFNGTQHDLTVLLGHEMSQSVSEGNGISGDAGKEHYYQSSFYDVSKITTTAVSTYYTKSSMVSFFGRVNYKFADRYILIASLRADGSSVLAEGNKWGYFPSVAAAWRINEESFMKSTSDWLSNLKFRASYGISGNAAVGAYQTLATLTPTVNGSTDMIPASMSNKDLSWEKTKSLNFGLDFGFLNNRINGSIDYYINKTTDLLYYKSAPASSIYTSVLANVGETSGKGVEVALNAAVIRNKDFNWDVNMSYTHFTDKIEKLTDGLERNINGTSGFIVGEAVNIAYDYETNGTWGVGEFEKYVADKAAAGITVEKPLNAYGDPGTLKIADLNNDGKINEDDKRVYELSPKHIFGMTNTFTYKDFALSIQLYARLGGYMNYGLNSVLNYESANWGNLDYWTPNNQGAKFPSPGLNSDQQATYNNYKTTLQWEKADYFKIKDITLSYNLPKSIIGKVGVSNLRVYGSLKNFFSFCSVDNYDAERGGSISFPLNKQVVFGLNLQF